MPQACPGWNLFMSLAGRRLTAEYNSVFEVMLDIVAFLLMVHVGWIASDPPIFRNAADGRDDQC
jgi:hypothetical protein